MLCAPNYSCDITKVRFDIKRKGFGLSILEEHVSVSFFEQVTHNGKGVS